MKFTLLEWKTLWKRPAPSLARVVHVSWWVVTWILVALLFLDGLIFYRFGLGRVSEPLAGDVDEPVLIRVREDAVAAAAAKIEERLARFNATATPAADIPDPFR